MICAVKPYEGQEPYIFFSYCHDDEAIVYPIIEQMGADGYRIWYDDGIHPGEDWPEVIARNIAGCAVCIAAVTSRSVESHNCRNEITFVVNQNKTFVPVILEQFEMSLGVKLQLGSGQYIVKYNIPSESDFFTELYKAKGLEACWGRQSQIDVHRYELVVKRQKEKEEQAQRQREQEEKERLQREKEAEAQRQREQAETGQQTPKKPQVNDTNEKTTRSNDIETVNSPPEVFEGPTPERGIAKALLIRATDGASFALKQARCTLGRSKSCTVFLNDKYVEPEHAVISKNHGEFTILAHHSVNGTALNGRELPEETQTALRSPAMLDIAGEAYLFLAGGDAERALNTRSCAFLESKETKEPKALGADVLELGQNHVWENGTLSDEHISHEHGRIVPMPQGGYGYEAHKQLRTNGTYYNGDKVAPGERFLLCDGDRLGLGKSCNLVYHLIELREEGN